MIKGRRAEGEMRVNGLAEVSRSDNWYHRQMEIQGEEPARAEATEMGCS